MRADVRDPDGNCMAGDEERGDQPCGSTSSDSNSNGDVKSPKASVTLKNHAVKTLPLKSATGSAKTCKCASKFACFLLLLCSTFTLISAHFMFVIYFN